MIHFFRRNRQGLLSQNRFSKYMLYAIGEIVLVVIGILIALSINNWNEERKLRKLERSYLIGILNDLKSDTTLLNGFVIPHYLNNHEKPHLYLDSLVENNLLSNEFYVSNMPSAFSITKSGVAFYPTIGTYDAIISEGNSGLIQDQELFSSVQELYEIWHGRNKDLVNRRDKIVDDIKLKYTYNFMYESKIEMFQNKQFLADLYFSYEYKKQYVGFLGDLQAVVLAVIDKLETELLHD